MKTLKFEVKNVDYHCGGGKARSTDFENNFMTIYSAVVWLLCLFVRGLFIGDVSM